MSAAPTSASGRLLSGQTAIVTGAAWGIGRAIARNLVAAGCRVVLADVDESGLEESRDACDPGGDRSLALRTDVCEEADVVGLVQRTVAAFGGLDIMVNNAGIYPTCDVVDMTVEEWDRVLDVNLRGTFLCAREAARVMVRQGRGGRIINTASAAGVRASNGKAHYCASKAGVILFTKALAIELAPHGILVNAVSPGLVETEPKLRVLEADPGERRRHQEKVKRLLLGRPCPADDVARGVLFLAGPDSTYITGHILHVDGGATAGTRL